MMSLKKASRTKSLSLSDDFPLKGATRTKNVQSAAATKKVEDSAKIIKYIDENIIGKGVAFLGPFGRRKVVYADYATSGRSLQFLEDYINKEVLPALGDVRCISAVTGLQSQLYKNEARDLIRVAVNASSDDEIIFCDGSFTSPSERLCYLLCYQYNKSINTDNDCDCGNKTCEGPVLFVSTSEPFTNIQPWVDAGAQVEKITKTREGFLDLVDLEKRLTKYMYSKRQLIGLFSGTSRLTGILADDVATTILLHQYGALSIWDFSLTATYAHIDTNPLLPGATKDALFFSTQNLIGGVQAPEILIIKKSLIANCNTTLHDTVGVISAVRAGLVVQLKESLGIQAISTKQEKICKQMLSHIRTIREILLLGPSFHTTKRLSTVCFLVRHPRGAFLHHRFIVAVLNDVFGIQASAEGHIGEVLGINGKMGVEYERLLADDSKEIENIRPGYTRISLPFFMPEQEVAFILEALKMVATEAWKLLPQYEVDIQTGEWKHHSNALSKERKWLGAIRYTDGKMLFSDRRISGPGMFPQNYADCLHTARNLFNKSRKMAQRTVMTDNLLLKLNTDVAEFLRWYMLPGEAHQLLIGNSQNVKHSVPFDPHKSINDHPSLLMYRHNSLSALDVKRYKSRSLPVSPVQMPTRHLSTTSESPPPECRSPPIIRFSLGGEVTTLMNISSPHITNLINNDRPSRNRCHSWGSDTIITDTRKIYDVVTVTQPISAARVNEKNRNCSCSSQTDLLITDSSDSLLCNPCLPNYQQAGLSSSDCNEDIQAYVKEVTNELATEIKSEIREVISKVEDVLDNTEPIDTSMINFSLLNHINSADELKNDSVSASDVAEYIKEFTKDMASEVKSEIREVVTAVDEIIASDLSFGSRKNSPPDINEKLPPVNKGLLKQRYSDSITAYNRLKLIDFDKQRSESFPRPSSTNSWHHQNTAPSPELSTTNCPYTGAISKLIDSKGTASQDSGINMCFHESDEYKSNCSQRTKTIERFSSTSSNSENGNDIIKENNNVSVDVCNENLFDNKNTPTPSPSPQIATVKIKDNKTLMTDIDLDSDLGKWHYLPKDAWRQTAEAIDEFEMLKDGDKILVCLSGSCTSICLLHALRQFTRARGIHVKLGAVSVGILGVDPRALMLYLKDLGIEYFYEEQGINENLKNKLYLIARRRNYNVLATGHTLDKLADEFMSSILQKGKLTTIQAHSCNFEDDLRVIRPFIYVRERILEDFCIQKEMPIRPSKSVYKGLNGATSLLKVQEIINPNVYTNIKTALKPLLSFRNKGTKSSYELLKTALITRD